MSNFRVKITHICEKCGREFVYVPEGIKRDHYPPPYSRQDKAGRYLDQCGGNLRRLENN
jgi:hypothetical protein